jgi:U4/U6.U5 tri-snRNP-associated protein 1
LQTKKKRPSRRVPEASAPEDGDMAVDAESAVPAARDLDANFVDDDDLQAALSRSRMAKTRKMKKVSPEELAMRSMFF